jgi:hypothetical protein
MSSWRSAGWQLTISRRWLSKLTVCAPLWAKPRGTKKCIGQDPNPGPRVSSLESKPLGQGGCDLHLEVAGADQGPAPGRRTDRARRGVDRQSTGRRPQLVWRRATEHCRLAVDGSAIDGGQRRPGRLAAKVQSIDNQLRPGRRAVSWPLAGQSTAPQVTAGRRRPSRQPVNWQSADAQLLPGQPAVNWQLAGRSTAVGWAPLPRGLPRLPPTGRSAGQLASSARRLSTAQLAVRRTTSPPGGRRNISPPSSRLAVGHNSVEYFRNNT